MAEEDGDDENAVSQTLFTSKWLVSIIISAVENKPGLSNGDLHSILAPYGKPYALTCAILQETRKLARSELFGDARENAKFVFTLEDELKLCGQSRF